MNIASLLRRALREPESLQRLSGRRDYPWLVVDATRVALSVLIVASVLAGILSLRHHRPPGEIP